MPDPSASRRQVRKKIESADRERAVIAENAKLRIALAVIQGRAATLDEAKEVARIALEII